jgi:hypothetical protein
VRGLGATPHVTQNDTPRRSAIAGRTTRHWGYQVSRLVRKRIEETFGWMKTIGGQRKTRYRGTPRVGLDVHPGGGLQPDPAAEAAGCRGVADTRSLFVAWPSM